jgi:hypothetical protein
MSLYVGEPCTRSLVTRLLAGWLENCILISVGSRGSFVMSRLTVDLTQPHVQMVLRAFSPWLKQLTSPPCTSVLCHRVRNKGGASQQEGWKLEWAIGPNVFLFVTNWEVYLYNKPKWYTVYLYVIELPCLYVFGPICGPSSGRSKCIYGKWYWAWMEGNSFPSRPTDRLRKENRHHLP